MGKKSFTRARLCPITIFCACLLLTGCWDRKELNQIAINAATALDWNGKEWVVSFQVIIPQSISSQGTSGSLGQQAPVMVFSTSGGSMRGAVQKSSIEMPRSLFFAHNRILVIGEKAASHGISQLMDVYLRNADARETVSLLVAGGEGRKILEQVIPLEKLPGAAIQNMIQNEDQNSSNFNQVMMYKMMNGMTSDSSYTLVPEVIISGNGVNNSIATLKNTSFKNKLRLGRLGIFKQDKLVGWFTSEEGYGINWIRNTVNSTVLYFGCSKGSKNYKSAVRIYRTKSKLKPIFKSDGQWIMRVEATANADLLENGCQQDVSKPEGLKIMEEYAKAEVVDLMNLAFHSAVEKKADVFGFADMLHKHYPKVWKMVKNDWEQKFPTIQLEPNVQLRIVRIGMSNKPFNELLEKSDK
ncbi:spore germination protein KC [Paenibacillus sp. yr247]|uniref:Ger(x)C family spore germination protein n=1 Tax=Paenibacillus sp. yr247 TaxID=1761880 RepID=UPI00088B6A50|nr:Ger(x)C family spore germination protein [Paenibacillus sp. yr247]SDN30600.1 spore germination protein KC [Paenibacillus sp. yr247]